MKPHQVVKLEPKGIGTVGTFRLGRYRVLVQRAELGGTHSRSHAAIDLHHAELHWLYSLPKVTALPSTPAVSGRHPAQEGVVDDGGNIGGSGRPTRRDGPEIFPELSAAPPSQPSHSNPALTT